MKKATGSEPVAFQGKKLFLNHFCCIFFQVREIKGGEEVEEGFVAADLLHAAVFMDHDFLMAEAAVVVVSFSVVV